ncbi:Histidinol-phosphate aminotransferase, partial [Clarias magur]
MHHSLHLIKLGAPRRVDCLQKTDMLELMAPGLDETPLFNLNKQNAAGKKGDATPHDLHRQQSKMLPFEFSKENRFVSAPVKCLPRNPAMKGWCDRGHCIEGLSGAAAHVDILFQSVAAHVHHRSANWHCLDLH